MVGQPSRFLRGLLELCLLALLEERADYGLSLAHRLSAAGLGEIPGGTLYPALLRMERRGLVSTTSHPSSSGPARKYYALTAAGHEELECQCNEWRTLSTALTTVLQGTGTPSGARP